MLSCSLLDCDEGWNKVSIPEAVSSLSGSSLLECSSPENCVSASSSQSELSRSRIRAGIWGCLVGGTMLTASVAQSIRRAVGIQARNIRSPDAIYLATPFKMFRWKIRICQSIHLWRAARQLRLPPVSGVGNFISARRLMRSWAPFEKAPLRLIPKSAILGKYNFTPPYHQPENIIGCTFLDRKPCDDAHPPSGPPHQEAAIERGAGAGRPGVCVGRVQGKDLAIRGV